MAQNEQEKLVLITGGAKRIGAEIVKTLHQKGYCVAIHFNTSRQAAHALASELNQIKPNSASIHAADLAVHDDIQAMADEIRRQWGGIDGIINNASQFYPTTIGNTTEEQWEQLFASNVKGAYFLSQSLIDLLILREGFIVNIADIHAQKPLKAYAVYCMAKAALVMMTKAMAKECAPSVRINAIAPGAILWPEHGASLSEGEKDKVLSKIPLKKQGQAYHIAQAVMGLIENEYITGQVLAVDGGRGLT